VQFGAAPIVEETIVTTRSQIGHKLAHELSMETQQRRDGMLGLIRNPI
jgi:hypothetical protein